MTTISKYRLYCITDSKFEYQWAETEPTLCPTNSAHTIDSNTTTIVDSVTPNIFKVKEEEVATQGLYQFQGFNQSIPLGTIGDVTSFTHTWPFPITIMNGWFMGTTSQVGDSISVVAAPNTVIGTITAPVSSSATTISVTSTVLDNVFVGCILNLTDGVQLSNLGRVLSIDKINSQVTVETGSSNSFSPSSPTYVRLTANIIQNLHINTTGMFSFASKKLGGRPIPAGIPLVIQYTNNSGISKMFAYNIEILY